MSKLGCIDRSVTEEEGDYTFSVISLFFCLVSTCEAGRKEEKNDNNDS